MNKIALILCFFVIFFMGPPLFAEIHGKAEIGQDTEEQLYFTVLQISLDFEALNLDNSLYGGIECWMIPGANVFKPFLNLYTIGYTIQYDIFFINLQYWCGHAVWNGQDNVTWKDTIQLNDDQTTISAGIKW